MQTEIAAPSDACELVPVIGRPAYQNAAAVYIAGLAPGSRRTMRAALDLIAGILTAGRIGADALPWGALRFQHTQAVRAELMARYTPAGVNKRLAALRGTLRAAWRLGQMTAEDYTRAADLGSVRGETLLRGRALDAGEIAALMATCANDPTPAGVRDSAIFAVALTTGLRREELTALDLADYNAASCALTVRSGKGAKGRITYVVNGAADALADWLTIRGAEPGPLFWPMVRGGHVIAGRRMTPQAILELCKRRGQAAGLRAFSPHDLRRSYITALLSAGVDTLIVSKLAGHANVATTARYDRRPEAAKLDASSKLFVPYRRRMI